jgi:hypothetical protein
MRDVEVVWQRWRYTLGTSFNILADELPSVAILVIFFFHTKVFGHRLEPASASTSRSLSILRRKYGSNAFSYSQPAYEIR